MPTALFLTLVLAQAPHAETADPAQIERIRQALAEAPAIAVQPATRAEGTVFRMTVQGRKPGQPVWADRSGVPPYVRTFFHSYHHEFLEQVTPEFFRGATLYPNGIPVVSVIEFLAKAITLANRKRQEANAKEEVRQALAELLACRANPDRPGC